MSDQTSQTSAARVTSVRMTYYDTAMALLEIGSLRLLTDPVLDPAGAVFEEGPLRLEKTGAAAVTAAALGRIDAVLLSHDQHGDNLDRGGRALLASVPRVLTTLDGAGRLSGELPGVRVEGLVPWATTTLVGADGFTLTVTGTPARHGPAGTEEVTGPVTGFLLSWDEGTGYGVYVSGDTVPFEGTEEVARRASRVGVAVLHLGRVQLPPMGQAHFSMTAAEAAALGGALGARHVVPIHTDGWAHFTENRASAKAALSGTPVADRVTWLAPGVPQEFAV
jgi:L-ascorbate metabolism protein UlaG (beta-lactamase superfamily)